MPIINILIYSFIAGLSTLFGVWLVRRYQNWTKRNAIFLISFAVGILLANAFFNLLPEAISLSPDIWMYYVFGGILFLFILEHIITIHACIEPEECDQHPFGITSVIGIGIHSLIDGIIIGIGFKVSPFIGLITALSVIAHEIPEGIFTYTLLKHANIAEKKNLIYCWLVALATPIGALLTAALISRASISILGPLLAFAAGSFIYVGASDLTPQIHKRSSVFNIVIILVGIVFVMLLSHFFE